jgi:archaellum component FlaC
MSEKLELMSGEIQNYLLTIQLNNLWKNYEDVINKYFELSKDFKKLSYDYIEQNNTASKFKTILESREKIIDDLRDKQIDLLVELEWKNQQINIYKEYINVLKDDIETLKKMKL